MNKRRTSLGPTVKQQDRAMARLIKQMGRPASLQSDKTPPAPEDCDTLVRCPQCHGRGYVKESRSSCN